MLDVIILELLMVISFLYSLLLPLISFAPVEQVFLVFLWTFASATAFVVGSRKAGWLNVAAVLMFLPLLVYEGILAVNFILITAIPILVYAKTSMLRGNHRTYAKHFKSTALIFLPVIYLRSLPIIVFSGSWAHAAPFLIIYFTTSVLLIRTIRHMDSRMDRKKIKKANVRYMLMIFAASVLVAVDQVRDFVVSLVRKLPYLVIYPVYWLSQLVGYIFEFLSQLSSKKGGSVEWQWPFPEETVQEQLEEVIEDNIVYLDLSLIETILGILMLAALIYLVYRIVAKTGDRLVGEMDYVEDREYIKEPKQKKKKRVRDNYPPGLTDQIRFYYRRYLDKLTGKKVEVLRSDTSLEINDKAQAVFPAGTERIRGIYIESRYGEKPVDQESVQEMERLCKEL